MTTEQIRLAEKDREIEILRLKLAIAGGQNGLRPFLFRSRSASIYVRRLESENPSRRIFRPGERRGPLLVRLS